MKLDVIDWACLVAFSLVAIGEAGLTHWTGVCRCLLIVMLLVRIGHMQAER